MARSATRPIVGTDVWYITTAPPTVLPQAAKVVNVATPAGSGFGVGVGPVLDLVTWNAAGTSAVVTGVPFHYGTRPTSGAWCTMPRVNMPATATSWPSGAAV